MHHSVLDKAGNHPIDLEPALFAAADATLPVQDDMSKGPPENNSFGSRFSNGRF